MDEEHLSLYMIHTRSMITLKIKETPSSKVCGACFAVKILFCFDLNISGPVPGLELPAPLSGCMTEQKCPLRVYRWLGPFVGGGTVPEHLMMSCLGRTWRRLGLFNAPETRRVSQTQCVADQRGSTCSKICQQLMHQ